MVREVDLSTFAAARADGALVLDVREPEEYVGGHVPGAQLAPLSTLGTRVGELPRHATVYVICASGNRSTTAAEQLCAAGVDAVSVAGGTSAWIRQGRPVLLGLRADESAA